MSPASDDSPSAGGTHLWLPNQVPQRLGAYELRSLLGKGGMGMVFEGRHLLLGQRVAIKVLHPDLPHTDRFVKRFHREMAAFGQLGPHPNLVRAVYAGEESGLFYLVMEYVEGQTLERVVQKHGPLAEALACEIVRQVALGLEGVRKAGLVHRDIKPANLMLASDGTIRILDLGLVRLRLPDTNMPELTGTGVMLGTLSYQAPEQADDPRRVDIRADVYSLGCTLYHLLTGRVPYAEHSSPASKIHAHAYVPFPAVDRPVHDDVAGLIARMTAKDPAARPVPLEVVEAVAPLARGAELAPLLDEGPADDDSFPARETVVAHRAPEPTTAPSPIPPARRPRAVPGRLVAWCFGVLAVVSGVGLFLYARSGPATGEGSTPGGQALVGDGDKTPVADPILAAGDDPPSLDALAPYEPHDLLKRAPVQAFWARGDGTAFRAYDAVLGQLIVSSPKNSLFHLGRLHAHSFALQVQIKQMRWTGGAGVYLGYRPAKDDPSSSVFQYFHFGERTTPAGKDVFTLIRGIGRMRVVEGRKVFDWGDKASVDIIPRPQGEATLVLEVVRHRLHKVRLGAAEFEKLTAPDAERHFSPADHEGCIGLSNSAGSCVFHKASLTLQPER